MISEQYKYIQYSEIRGLFFISFRFVPSKNSWGEVLPLAQQHLLTKRLVAVTFHSSLSWISIYSRGFMCCKSERNPQSTEWNNIHKQQYQRSAKIKKPIRCLIDHLILSSTSSVSFLLFCVKCCNLPMGASFPGILLLYPWR